LNCKGFYNKNKQGGFLKFKQEDILLKQIKQELQLHLQPKSLACFDADGTLWAEDANDLLLQYQETHNLRNYSDLPSADYKENRLNRCKAFASRQAGFLLDELKAQIHQVLDETPLHVFPVQRKILNHLKQKGVLVYVVTASLKWLVEEAVKKYQLPVYQVLGFESVVKNNQITSQLITPYTYGVGKKESLLQATGQKQPVLASGNSLSDLSLLEMAKVSVVIHFANPKSDLYKSERQLHPFVKKQNWILFKT